MRRAPSYRTRKNPPDCDLRHCLTTDQRAALTGYSGRAVRALAHLRECWCIGDPDNASTVVASIRALLGGHSLREIPKTCARVLTDRLDHPLGVRLLAAVGLEGERTWASLVDEEG